MNVFAKNNLEKMNVFIKNNIDKLNSSTKNKKKKIIIVAALLFFILLSSILYAIVKPIMVKKSNSSYINKMLEDYPLNSYDGNYFATGTYPILKDVVFLGDSYAHYISTKLGELGYDLINYSYPGFMISELDKVFELGAKSEKDFAVVFIGPNDLLHDTSPSDFYDAFQKQLLKLKKDSNMIIILNTYLRSRLINIIEGNNGSKYKIEDYNNEIMKLVDNERVYFLDLDDINEKLSIYQNDTDDVDDMLHFNRKFSIEYINRLYKKIIDIKKEKMGI